MRELRLIFGATTAATAAVLAIFMAGLGIGSALLGKVADRVPNPLRMYGLLEVAIALSAATTPWLISQAGRIYLSLGGQESLGVAGATAARLLLTAAIMAIPTVLMGGTLPAAVRSVTRPTDLHRRALGVLYGSNTLGAVLGSALATFFALEALGTRATLTTGCALGFLAGVAAISLSRSLAESTDKGTPSVHAASARTLTPQSPPDDAHQRSRDRLLYLTAAVLGFTFFALELVWYRMLGPILGGTAFTFGLILCVALLGIGLGGIAYNVVFSRWKPTWAALAATCGLEALFTIIPFAIGDRLALLAASQSEAAVSFGELIVAWAYVTSIVVLPVSLVAGIQFPLLIALLGSGRREVSRHLGFAYAWNTFGAIAGSLVAGFGAMPLLTAPGMWQAIAVTLAALSILIAIGTLGTERRAVAILAAMAIATVGLTFAQGPTAVWRHSGIGAGRADLPYSDTNRLRRWTTQVRHLLIWEAEGIESSIGITGADGLSFVVNGKSDGNSLVDSPTQIGAAILGGVLHDDPKTGLVIGLGTGESAGWLAHIRNMQHVDVVELEPAIDEMARRCRELNWDVLNNSRIRRIYNDGREFVFTTDNQYDIIISEPSNPYRAGVASLYTTEFYQAAKRRLKPGGLFIQWLQAYEADALTVHTVVATARSAFDHVELWQTFRTDLQLVCSAGPVENSAAELRERLAPEVVQSALKRTWKMYDLEGFLAHFVANADWASGVANIAMMPRNTDDRTVLEYSFAKTVGGGTEFSVEKLRAEVAKAGYHRPSLSGENVDWNRVEILRQELNVLLGGELSYALLSELRDQALVDAFSRFRAEEFQSVVDSWPAELREPADPIQRFVLAMSYAEVGRGECLGLLAAVENDYPAETAAIKANYHWRTWDVTASAQWIERYLASLADDPWVIAIIADPALLLTVDIAKADRAAARRLYSLLSQPFASHRYHHGRLVTQATLAEYVGPQQVVESLAKFEPNVPWTARLLESRAKAYAELKHPLAERAQRDLEWFRRHQPAGSQSSPP
jgi:spermidine synthase/MFS family permease